MVHPIALISCWVETTPSQGCKPPGFHVGASLVEKASPHNSQLFTDLPLFPGRDITIGRNHYETDISINHPYVSRKHFVIYSVVYDLENMQNQPPLIYVRDYQSLGGTYVDGVCIGNKENGASPGFYLSRDVVITVKPHWRFRVSLLDKSGLRSPLNAIQLKESNLFRNRYIITNRLLGSGASASVHLAVNVQTGKQLACKIHDLDRLRLQDPKDLVRRTLDETDILGKLRHPNLPTFEYAIRSTHTLYTFTELATGGDLFSMRLVRGVFTEQDCKLVIRQILSAIRYLHEGGIAHRDLKPENIFFATGPDVNSRIIVGDLGFAKSMASGRMISRVGTTHYMAPEIDNRRDHSLEVDMWSIGMITVFLLAPDDNTTPSCLIHTSQVAINEWLDSIFEDPFQQEISTHCQDFIRSCLIFEPQRRMKASNAKHHSWFQQQSDKRQIKFRVIENANTWKPTHFIAPPVQELPDAGDASDTAQPQSQDGSLFSSTSFPSSGKRKYMSSNNPQGSTYFTGPISAIPKRLKVSSIENETNLIYEKNG